LILTKKTEVEEKLYTKSVPVRFNSDLMLMSLHNLKCLNLSSLA